MRITQISIFNHTQNNLAKVYSDLFEVQRQIATGKRLYVPSDDPASVRRVLDVRQSREQIGQIQKNLNLAESELSLADGVLQNMSELTARAREIAIAGANGTASADDRGFMADEVDGILSQFIALANTKSSSGFLFGGSERSTAPYESVNTANGEQVVYGGNRETIGVDIGNDLQLQVNVPGSQIFDLLDRQTTEYLGDTGAAAGTGTDSARGSDSLLLEHVATVLGDGHGVAGGDSESGLRPSLSSPGGDTVLGSGNVTISVTDTSGTGTIGTVSINGGPTVPWSNTDTDFELTTPDGDILHLDFSAISAGFSGAVAVSGEGTFSLDGGLTSRVIDFTNENQLLTDSETGKSIFINATGIVRAGAEDLRFTGTYDLFASLVALRDQLRNEDGLDLETNGDGIRATLSELERGQEGLSSALGEVGARVRLIDLNRNRANEMDLLLVQNQADLEDVDFARAAVELATLETVLQASVAMSGRITTLPTLVNVL